MESNLPNIWVEVQLIDVLKTLENGSRPKGGVQGILEGVPSLGGEHLDNNGDFKFEKIKFIPDDFALKMNRGRINENDILIVKDGATTGKTSFVDENFPFELAFVNEHVFIARPFSKINSKFLFYFLYSKTGYERIMENFTGSAQGGINQKFANNTLIPLAPLAEQNRIVEKLDTLFAQLETIKASMAKVPELLKNFRQQVLTQAVTGRLFNNNEINSLNIKSPITIGEVFKDKPISWNWVKLIELAKLESGHTPRKSKSEYWENGDIPWISLQDIRAAHGKIISETKFMPNEIGIKNSSARLLPKGTVCFSRDISVGFTTVMGREMATTQHFANWICGESLNNMYLLYAFMAAKDFLIASGKGTTVGTIYMPALKEFRILLPPIDLQKKIVSRVESLFTKADAIEKQYETLKAKIDSLPQAILHKAFKGELTQQLDSDGDARELLREIEMLRNTQQNKGKKPTKKSHTQTPKPYAERDEVLGMVAEN